MGKCTSRKPFRYFSELDNVYFAKLLRVTSSQFPCTTLIMSIVYATDFWKRISSVRVNIGREELSWNRYNRSSDNTSYVVFGRSLLVGWRHQWPWRATPHPVSSSRGARLSEKCRCQNPASVIRTFFKVLYIVRCLPFFIIAHELVKLGDGISIQSFCVLQILILVFVTKTYIIYFC